MCGSIAGPEKSGNQRLRYKESDIRVQKCELGKLRETTAAPQTAARGLAGFIVMPRGQSWARRAAGSDLVSRKRLMKDSYSEIDFVTLTLREGRIATQREHYADRSFDTLGESLLRSQL